MTNTELPCYEITKTFDKLNLTAFGRMKLGVIPEGILVTTYNYLLSQSSFPTFSSFLDKCSKQCTEMNINLKPRWHKFLSVCEDLHIDSKAEPATFVPTPKETKVETRPELTPDEVESEFWKCEKFKMTEQGRHNMAHLGDPHSPFKNRMVDLYENDKLANKGLFCSFMDAYLIGKEKPVADNLSIVDFGPLDLPVSVDLFRPSQKDPEAHTKYEAELTLLGEACMSLPSLENQSPSPGLDLQKEESMTINGN